MTRDESKDVVRRAVEECWNTGNQDIVENFYADDFVFHGEGGQDTYGPASIREWLRVVRGALPDLTYEINAIYAEDDKVAFRYNVRGTHEGDFQGIPPTNASVDLTGHQIMRLENGKIVEAWGVWDTLGLLQQLGIVPPFGPPAEEPAATR